jgi:intracellular sulfur oxidation DsrE/DsrF family protein
MLITKEDDKYQALQFQGLQVVICKSLKLEKIKSRWLVLLVVSVH